jgi:hypothetical protein
MSLKISITAECLPTAAFVSDRRSHLLHGFHRWIFPFFGVGFAAFNFLKFLYFLRFAAFRCCFLRFSAFRCCFLRFPAFRCCFPRFPAFLCCFPLVILALIPLSFLQVCGAFWGGLLPLDVFNNCQKILFIICTTPIFKSLPLQRRNFETNFVF